MAVPRNTKPDEEADDFPMQLQTYESNNIDRDDDCEESFSSLSSSLPSNRSSKRSPPIISFDVLPKSKVPKVDHLTNPVDQGIERKRVGEFLYTEA